MRKINKGTMVVIGASAALVVVAIIGLYLPAILNAKEPVVIPAKSIVFDKYDNEYETSDDIKLDTYWDGTKVIDIEEDQVVLGDSSLAFESSNNTAMLLDDAVVILPDNTFYKVDENNVIEKSGSGFTIDETSIDSGTVLKTGDRNYVVLGNCKVEGGEEFEGFTTVKIDKAGIPTISTRDGVYRYSDPKVLVLENGSKFDLSNEIIKTSNDVVIDLKQVGGSTSEYVELGGNSNVDTGEKAKDTSSNSDASNGTSNNSGSTSNKDAAKGSSGSGATSDATNSGGGSSGESFTVTEDMYKALFTKKPPTGNIMGVDEIGPTSAKVHVNFFDSSNTLIGNPTIKVMDQKGTEVYSTVVNGSTVAVNSLSPNQKYTVQLIASYDLGEGVTTSTLANSNFTTKNISQSTQVNVVRSTSADVTVRIDGDVMLDSASIVLESSTAGGDWTEEDRIDLNTNAAAKNGMFLTFSNLSPDTIHRISIDDAVYRGTSVAVDGYSYFTTLAANKVKSTNAITSMAVSSDDNMVDVKVTAAEKNPNIEYQYTVTDQIDGSTDSYLVTSSPNVKFNQYTGLEADHEYVVNVAMYEDGVQVMDSNSAPFLFESEFEITSITQHAQKTEITYTGVSRVSEPTKLVLYYVDENDEYVKIKEEERFGAVGNKMVVDVPLKSGEYFLALENDTTNMRSPSFNYLQPESKNIKQIEDKIYVNTGSKIEVYDATSGKVLSVYSVMDSSIRNTFETIKDFYVIDNVIFAITSTEKVLVFNDVDNKYSEYKDLKVDAHEELNGTLYLQVNGDVKEIK